MASPVTWGGRRMAIPEVGKSLTKGFAGNSGEGKSENGRINTRDLWWAWVDLNHRPRPYQGPLRCYMHSIIFNLRVFCGQKETRCWLVHLVVYFTCDLSLWEGITSTSGFNIGTR